MIIRMLFSLPRRELHKAVFGTLLVLGMVLGEVDIASANGLPLTKVVTDTTTFTVPYATNGRTRTWTYNWSSTGRLLSVDGPLAGPGDTKSFTYNTNGFLATVTNEVGHTTAVSAWDGRGNPTIVTDPNGIVSTYTYNIDGNVLTAITNPGPNQAEYQFAYTNVGDISQITLPMGGTLAYTYDNARHLTQVTNSRSETITLTYNANGDILSSTVKDASATLVAQQNAAYDELGRIIQQIGALPAQTESIGYDKVSNPTSTTNGVGKTTTNSFDALNRLMTHTDPELHATQLAYNPQDELTSEADARSHQTTRTVDGFGDVIQEISPDRGTRTYWYDAAGRMIKLVDGDGEETDFTYDNAGRILTKSFPTAPAQNVTYGYDSTAGGNVGIGRLTSVSNDSGTTSFTYDAFGRVVAVIQTINGHSFTTEYAYDGNAALTQITYPSGRTVSYARSTDGLVTAVTTAPSGGASTPFATSVVYMPFGPLAGLLYGNGLTLTRSFDQNYWLSRIQVTGTGTALDLSFAYFNDGRLSTVTDNASTGRGNLATYTDAGRLLSANGPWGNATYAYDATGNRSAFHLTGGSSPIDLTINTDNASNRIQSVLDVNNGNATIRSFSFRAGGDVSQEVRGADTYLYGYNAAKRLTSVQKNGTLQGSYAYDALGRRVWRQVTTPSTVTTDYIFDQRGHLLAEADGSSGSVIKEYVWIDDLPIGVIDSSSGTVQTYYIHTGAVSEPLVLTDSTQAKVWDAFVEPYGIAKTFATPSATIDLRLPGQWEQIETGGLFQNGIRDYDPTLGRYVQADPLGIEAGPNLYAYVDGNPLNRIDPLGLQSLPSSPPPGIPGGPWTATTGQRPGSFYGPKQPHGPRIMCQYVPPANEGGPPGSIGYWKTKDPSQRGWRHFSLEGVEITAEQAHPNPLPENPLSSIVRLGGPLSVFIGTLMYSSPAY